jgi:hypothetical protein
MGSSSKVVPLLDYRGERERERDRKREEHTQTVSREREREKRRRVRMSNFVLSKINPALQFVNLSDATHG